MRVCLVVEEDIMVIIEQLVDTKDGIEFKYKLSDELHDLLEQHNGNNIEVHLVVPDHKNNKDAKSEFIKNTQMSCDSKILIIKSAIKAEQFPSHIILEFVITDNDDQTSNTATYMM